MQTTSAPLWKELGMLAAAQLGVLAVCLVSLGQVGSAWIPWAAVLLLTAADKRLYAMKAASK